MKVENIAKTYNTLTKYIRNAIFYNNGENRIMYKVKNKFYFINEKDNTCKCICEVDSSFLECMDTNLKENVIFSDFIDSDYDIETQLKELQESKNEHIFAIFDSIVAEIDRQDLLENDFFKFCIHQIEKENNIVYSENEIDSSIDTNMQEADTEPTETKAQIQTDFNAENTEPSIKESETQLEKETDIQTKQTQAEQDKQTLKRFNEYKEFMDLKDKIEPINHRIKELQNYLTSLENGEYYKKEIKERTDELNFRKKVVKSAIREHAQMQTEKSKEILEFWKNHLKIERKAARGWANKEAVQEYIKNEIQSTQNYLMQYKHKKQNCIERIQELSCNKAVMNYMLENLRTKTPLRHTFAPLPLYTESLKEQGYKEYELRDTTIYFSETNDNEYINIDNCLNVRFFDFNGVEIVLESDEIFSINLLENVKEYMRKNIIDIDKAEFNTHIENKYINEMQSLIKESNITDKDTIEKIMCLKDDISRHVGLIESLHNEKEAKIEFEKIFKLHFIDIAMTYPQAYNGIANNQVLKEKLKEVIFEAIKQENTESIARKDFSNKALQNTESKQELDLKAKKQTLLTFSMKDISLSHKQHKSFTDYKHIDSFNSVIEKRVIKAVIAKERSPPLHKGA